MKGNIFLRTAIGSTKSSGPVTVLAARLSEYGREGVTLIGEETARRVEKLFSLRSLGKLALKNLEDSGEVFEVTQ